jgi:hypothetical protein
MNQLKYRIHTDVQTQLVQLRKQLHQEMKENPKHGYGYADAPMNWDKLKSQTQPIQGDSHA